MMNGSNMGQWLAPLCVLLACVLTGCTQESAKTSAVTAPQNAAPLPKIRIVLAGDSTVNKGSGWGPGFAKALDPSAECINLALNGRSSKSFVAEGQWQKCLDARPNYVLIQFGHNDQPGKGPERETDPQTTYKQLLTKYIDESRASGAKPVLITSLERRNWGDNSQTYPSLTAYAQAVRELGRAKNIPVIDLNALSIRLYDKLGKSGMDPLSARAADGSVDNTHLNDQGADVIGLIVAQQLKIVMPELAPYIKG